MSTDKNQTDKPASRIILHTINTNDEELITMVLRMPKFLVGEFNTHRSKSRNSASARAIPHKRFRDMVEKDPFLPVFVKHERGMVANTPLEPTEQRAAQRVWRAAMNDMLACHRRLESLNVSKGQANRLLEAFFFTEVIATDTRPGWEAFFEDRAKKTAQTEIQQVAFAAMEQIAESEPVKDNLHIPFADPEADITTRLIMSVVNCARVSYLNHEGNSDSFDKAVDRFVSLVKDRHPSPFEHQAMSLKGKAQYNGNFGFFGETNHCQLRRIIEVDGMEKVPKIFKGFKIPKDLETEEIKSE